MTPVEGSQATIIVGAALEDFLHSVAAFGIALGFTVGVVIAMLRRGPSPGWIRAMDRAAVIGALVVPLVMFFLPEVAGTAERLMFLIAYAWFAIEARLSASFFRNPITYPAWARDTDTQP